MVKMACGVLRTRKDDACRTHTALLYEAASSPAIRWAYVAIFNGFFIYLEAKFQPNHNQQLG